MQRADAGTAWVTIANVAADSQVYIDGSVASSTTYDYRVRAVNSGGVADSNEISVTSAEVVAPNISLSANGYKQGWQNVDANWDAGGAAITLYRNSTAVYSGSASTYTDSRISKGGAVYDYQACPQETPEAVIVAQTWSPSFSSSESNNTRRAGPAFFMRNKKVLDQADCSGINAG